MNLYRDTKDFTLSEKIQILLEFISEKRKERLLSVLSNRTRFITVVLEDIYDPHNGSACLRSCDANGIQDIHIIERNNFFTTKEGVSMGSGKWLSHYRYNQNIYKEDPTIYCFNHLRSKGYRVFGMSSYPIEGKKNFNLEEITLDYPSAFVFGSEKNGLSSVALENLDTFIQIPMYGFVESYNISVACAITVYTIIQKLRKTKIDWGLSSQEKEMILFDWLKKDIPGYELILKTLSKR